MAALAATALAIVPSAGLAANQARFIGVDTDGTRTDKLVPIAVADDGKTTLGVVFGWDRSPNRHVIRDVVAQQTTEILGSGDFIWNASADLTRILFSTSRSYSPADDNGRDDLYVWDRPSDTFRFLSRDGAGKSLILGSHMQVGSAHLSANGNVAQFTVTGQYFEDDQMRFWNTQYAYDIAVDRITELSKRNGASAMSTGDDGRVAVNEAEVLVGDRRYPRPGADDGNNGSIVTSLDGGVVAWANGGRSSEVIGTKIVGVDTSNGNSGVINVPSWLQQNGYALERIENGASSVVVSATLEAGMRFAYARLDRAGNLRQIGEDIPMTDAQPAVGAGRVAVMSKNGKFSMTGLLLTKLGDAPLPGTEPNAPSEARLTDYLQFNDSICPFGMSFVPGPLKPTLRLKPAAQGSDLRKPTRATAKVFRTGATKPSNDMALSPGQKKDLWVGTQGGYRIDATVTLAGGEVLTGSETIASHAPPLGC